MNNFIFKSSKGLIKNSSLDLDTRMDLLLKEQRHQRSDLRDIKLMLNKLIINDHLQSQVDDYFKEADSNDVTECSDLDKMDD